MCQDFSRFGVNVRFVRAKYYGIGFNHHLSTEMSHGTRLLLEKCLPFEFRRVGCVFARSLEQQYT